LLFSIVMPCFNAANTVARTMSSVCSQTLTDFELIAVDDGSSDQTVEILLDCARQHMPALAEIRVLPQENRGVGAARNRGMSQARGDLIAFLDADDLWSPEYLRTVAGIFQTFPQLGALASNSWDMLPEGYHLHIKPESDGVLIIEDFFRAVRDGTMLVRTSGVAIRRSVTTSVGYMREDLLLAEDTEYWSRLAASRVCWGFLLQPLVFYDRVGVTSLSRSPSFYTNLPSPETWGKEIWPLLDPSMRDSFRETYLGRAMEHCWAYVTQGLDSQAKATAREAFPRRTGFRDTLFLLAVRFVPGGVHRLVWRAGSRVKRLVRRDRT
jgi:glycosyltransferase involved in cell wall biosynthesis